MATSDIDLTEGSGVKAATNTISEDAVTKHLQRVVLNNSSGAEVSSTLGQAAMAASWPSTIASDQTGFPIFPSPTTTGGLSIFRSLDLDESEEEVKATAGQLYKLRLTNFATTVRYVKLYNATAANTTVGTTTPIDTIPVPAGSSTAPTVITESFGGLGLTFGTALCLAATTGLADNDTGAPSANDVVATAYYK